MKKIQLKEICGVEVLSRANVRKLYDHIDADTEVIDMTGISFISRSVADELCIITDANPGCTLSGGSEDVEMMLDIVRKGRKRDDQKGEDVESRGDYGRHYQNDYDGMSAITTHEGMVSKPSLPNSQHSTGISNISPIERLIAINVLI